MIYDLPSSVTLNGSNYDINTDFRCVLDIMEVLNDPDLTGQERAFISLGYFYPDFQTMPHEDYEAATKALCWFISGGKDDDATAAPKRKIMDWKHDFPYIIGPVNKAIGHEIREDKHLHWWTFLSAYMDIGECLFSQILHIRQELADGKKLSKIEREWYRKNKDLVDLPSKNHFTASQLEFMRTMQRGD